MSGKAEDTAKKGRRWRFSKKKMKNDIEKEAVVFDLKDLLDKRNINLKPRVNTAKISKLSPSLLDILKKSVALGYFLEYLDGINKKCLLNFWLEAETLRMVSESNYSRRTPTTSRRRLSRTKSLTNTPPRSHVPRENSRKSFSEPNNRNSTNNIPDMIPVKNESIFSTEINPNFGIENGASVMEFRGSESFKNTFDPPLSTRRSSTLRSYEEFKSRARSRTTIVDAVEIYTKYISLNADYPINLPSKDRQAIEAAICKDENELEPSCFSGAQDYAFHYLERMYEDFLLTTNMISYQLNVIEEKEMKLPDVLYDETILFYFLEFLDVHGTKDVYEFYVTAENFEEDIERKIRDNCYDAEEAINDAMYIYERYFSMKCERQLIGDDKLRIVLENNICRDDGPQANCFCIPMAYAWTALSEVYLPMFLKSNMYTSYQSHLKKTLEHTEETKSCSSHSSLSLGENVAFVERNHSPLPIEKSESKLNLFEESNLEDFWFKPQHELNRHSTSRLALGHVNEFGMFCSGMEEQPLDERQQNSSVKKLGKKMKDLLRGETLEETEQLAWERARKIIDDIQKQTNFNGSTEAESL